MIDKIKEIIYRYMPDMDMLYEEENLYENGVDSLTMLKVIIEIENMFSIHINDEEIVEIRNINDISEIISKKINENAHH